MYAIEAKKEPGNDLKYANVLPVLPPTFDRGGDTTEAPPHSDDSISISIDRLAL